MIKTDLFLRSLRTLEERFFRIFSRKKLRNCFLIFPYLLFFLLLASAVFAEGEPPLLDAPQTTKRVPNFYSLPFQLRSVMPAQLVRFDTTFSAYKDNQNRSGGRAFASVLTGGIKLDEHLGVLVRLGNIANDTPAGLKRTVSPLNPLVGVLRSDDLANSWKLAFFLGAAFPVGAGGGNAANGGSRASNQAGILSRSALDNALFATNYLTLAPGIGVANLAADWTFQAELTLLQLFRTRGKQVDADSTRTNSTAGVAFGYRASATTAFLTEFRYQRWLANRTVKRAPSPAIHNLSFGVGPRFTLKFEKIVVKPGVAFIGGLLGPISRAGYTYPYHSFKTVFLDIPVIFL